MKNIILCADGTWNTPSGLDPTDHDTNVWKLYCALPDTPTQMKYYDSGVGTDGGAWDHFTGGTLGAGLFQNVQDCYSFLANVHDPGDRIFLFGFSRGAYTARSAAGMIAGFGVPTKNLSNKTTPEIFAAYREQDKVKRAALKQHLQDAYGMMPVNIAMVGVWDTVGALGVPGKLFSSFNNNKYGFLDTTLSDCVERACHAISIDERRASFQPTLWTDKDGKCLDNNDRIQQVWFAGVHCDVGGSYKESDLANITLGWMMGKAKECGLEFLPDTLTKYLKLANACAAGPAHDEWKLVPWGFAKRRTIPENAVLANSVVLRAASSTPAYRPENLLWDGDAPKGYQHLSVLPYLTE
jgi:uncharacterized protein (DUF2235 family)